MSARRGSESPGRPIAVAATAAAAHNPAQAARRRTIRYLAAALSALTALIYFLIGFRVLSVLDTPTDQIFGFFAGAGYALGVYLLLAHDRRLLWVLGALLQVFVVYQYFNLAFQRAPAYEVWGVLLRVPQVVLFIALVYLALRQPSAEPAGPGAPTPAEPR